MARKAKKTDLRFPKVIQVVPMEPDEYHLSDEDGTLDELNVFTSMEDAADNLDDNIGIDLELEDHWIAVYVLKEVVRVKKSSITRMETVPAKELS